MYFRKYLENQQKLISEYKWYRGEQQKSDPGEQACREWIEKYGAQYRKEYEAEFALIVDKVLVNTLQKIKKIQEESKIEIPPEVISAMAKVFLQQFSDEWTVEKAMKPKNIHIDEI